MATRRWATWGVVALLAMTGCTPGTPAPAAPAAEVIAISTVPGEDIDRPLYPPVVARPDGFVPAPEGEGLTEPGGAAGLASLGGLVLAARRRRN